MHTEHELRTAYIKGVTAVLAKISVISISRHNEAFLLPHASDQWRKATTVALAMDDLHNEVLGMLNMMPPASESRTE